MLLMVYTKTKYPELKPANKQLVGKIQKEHSLFLMAKIVLK
jgi:hypothetical protein